MIALFVDTARQYEKTKEYYGSSRKINYQKYIDKITKNKQVHKATAYVVQVDEEATPFIDALRYMGYTVRPKRAIWVRGRREISATNWTMGIVLDIVRLINTKEITEIIIGSNDSNFYEVIKWAKEEGVKVTVFSIFIPKSLRMIADHCIEMNDAVFDIFDKDPIEEVERREDVFDNN